MVNFKFRKFSAPISLKGIFFLRKENYPGNTNAVLIKNRRFQNELLVHTKESCPKCNLKIKKIRVGGRGTYVCENCQKIYLQKN